jgi:transposase
LTPAQTYEIWVQLLRGETTIAAAAEAWGVDRSTVMKLRQVAKQGALDARASPSRVCEPMAQIPQLVAARAEIARCVRGAQGDGVRLMLIGKGVGIERPDPLGDHIHTLSIPRFFIDLVITAQCLKYGDKAFKASSSASTSRRSSAPLSPLRSRSCT